MSGSFQTARRFYRSRPRWLAAQLALMALSVAAGVVIGVVLHQAIAGIVVGAVPTVLFGLVGLRLPSWRERIEERRWTP